MKYDSLIFGKDQTENIVSIEVSDEWLEVFTETNGIIDNHWLPNIYWILSNTPHGQGWTKLEGNQHYCWGKKYSNFQSYIKERNWLKKKQADIYYVSNDKEASMILNGMTYFKNMKVQDVSTLAFDIETTGLVHDETSKVLLISNTFGKNGTTTRRLFCFDNYPSQSALLDDWCKWVKTIDASVIIGHNIFGYDLPYLQFIADREQTSLKLGRDDSELKWDGWESKFRIDGSKDLHYKRCHIYGRNIIDTLFLSYKHDIGRNYDNYKLKYIIEKEGLEVKDRQFYDGSKIRDNYLIPEEWVKIKKYAEHDADDALALYNLMIPPFFYLTPSIPKTFQQMLYTASGSQINAFLVRSYLQEGHSISKTSEPQKFEGALSAGFPGIYSNVFKTDVSSLYPSIMLEYNTHDKFKDPKQNFSKMVKYFTNERLANKKLAKETNDLYYTGLEQAQKIIINSAYGMMGTPGLNYNSPHNAAFVTTKGREILQKAIIWATGEPYTQLQIS
jgi:DNA polymerase, archaea type